MENKLHPKINKLKMNDFINLMIALFNQTSISEVEEVIGSSIILSHTNATNSICKFNWEPKLSNNSSV